MSWDTFKVQRGGFAGSEKKLTNISSTGGRNRTGKG